jgi:hypothetical protein
MDIGVRARVVAGKVAAGPSSSTSLAFIVGIHFFFAFLRLLLSLGVRVVIVTTIGSRVVGRAGIRPPVVIVRVSISSFLSFVFAFAFNVAFILASFTFRGIGLITFALFSVLLIALLLSTIGLNVSLDAAIVA